ncbi:competence protein ComK [Siminovitchia sp. 179-K 8D1 HS]|uniref:competence protein ComK n=1 Tax=Siminovitchia sp. 179-K 8D1 HS TaxID=3142385 RepID=UPI0039A34886
MTKKDLFFVEDYEINPYTMMIKPAANNDPRFLSEIFEMNGRYLSSDSPFDIVRRSCEYFGSSFNGRRQGTKQLIGITHKAPIIVDPHTSIFLFPTASPTSPHCIWISHDYVASHERNGSDETIVTFQNNESHKLPVSFYSFENQLSRTAMLRIKFMQNMKRMENFGRLIHNQASEQKGPYRIGK